MWRNVKKTKNGQNFLEIVILGILGIQEHYEFSQSCMILMIMLFEITLQHDMSSDIM